MENKEREPILISCACGGEFIQVNEHIWSEEEHAETEFNLVMYKRIYYKPNIWRRLQYALWHIWTGEIGEDQIQLHEKDARKLGNYLLNRIDEKK